MQSLSGTGNVSNTPIKTIAATGLYLVDVRNMVFTTGQLHVTRNGVSLNVAGTTKPVPARFEIGDVIGYFVSNNTSAWAFDFELYDLSSTPEIG